MDRVIVAPVAVILPRKTKKDKRVPISLSWYRNADFRESNTVKQKYKDLLTDQIVNLPTYQKPEMTYVWYPETKRLGDLGNHTAVQQKFFEDALVELGKVPDDNWKYITANSQRFGGFDKQNPRVEIHIKETDPMNLQAILSEKELNEAIQAYVLAKGFPVEGMEMDIELTKGRGANGTYATVSFAPVTTATAKKAKPAKEAPVPVAEVEEEEEEVKPSNPFMSDETGSAEPVEIEDDEDELTDEEFEAVSKTSPLFG